LQAAKLEYDIPSGVWIKGDRKKKINPKAILKYSSMPIDGKKPQVSQSISQSVSESSCCMNENFMTIFSVFNVFLSSRLPLFN
jgi:hypothetical protein